jgi:hypothetical protein
MLEPPDIDLKLVMTTCIQPSNSIITIHHHTTRSPHTTTRFLLKEDFLCEMVSNYLSTALHSSEAAIMISSPANLHTVQLLLSQTGIDISKYIKTGALIMLDGYSFLSDLTKDDTLQMDAFQKMYVEGIETALRKFPRVCIYGDMVSGMMMDGMDVISGTLTESVLGDLAIEIEKRYHEFQAGKPNLVLYIIDIPVYLPWRSLEACANIHDLVSHPSYLYTSLT